MRAFTSITLSACLFKVSMPTAAIVFVTLVPTMCLS